MRNARSILAALGLAALALPFAARAAGTGGTITGKVDVLPSRYLGETVVYLKEVPGSHGPAKTITVD